MMEQRNQRGLSAIGFLVLLSVGGFMLTAAFKVGPLFMDNYFVNGSLQALANDDVHKMSERNIRRKVGAALKLNNVRDIDISVLEVDRQKTHTLVSLNYEKRVNFIGNIDVIVAFENLYDSSL